MVEMRIEAWHKEIKRVGHAEAQRKLQNNEVIIIRDCRRCGVELRDENCRPSDRKNENHICRECIQKSYKHTDKSIPPGRSAPQFLGVYVAEQLLSKVFKDVEVMPYRHPGFDIICNRGKLIDIKSGCTLGDAPYWLFGIRRNKIPDYFLCIAFDNRQKLTPLHLWMIPANIINERPTLYISESMLEPWSQYELALDRVNECCDIMKAK